MNRSPQYADLHLHSNRSDGFCTPDQLVEKALEHNLKAIAIVDHDDISALEEAIPFGKEKGIEVIPGVELSVQHNNLEFHLLGYCFDLGNPELQAQLRLFKENRVQRARKIVNKLSKLGVAISFEEVIQRAGEGTVGRPHIAEVLLEQGCVFSFQDAFNRYLGSGKPAYEQNFRMDFITALRLVRGAGGICSIAHPALVLDDEMIYQLIKAGIEGIETIHPKHNLEKTRYFSEIARRNGLVETGGSDYHGGKKGEEALGHYRISMENVLRLKEISSC
ncbi:MAG: PHP domain-containing protein [bacterium]